ncbi:MAG: hypothetical protein GWP14_07395 [Actinobacteria bacterium]|nr:hypothetical protein [Actinomycetota bacterium]
MSDRRYQIICLGLALAILLAVRLPRFRGRGTAGLDQIIQKRKQQIVPVRAEVKRDVMIDFPILVLGGFRGPLVMGLWIKAENEKNEQQWWDVKTYHEIIAHLQPNFPSVYVFNAWNLAYNLSVQWHELANKYLWVLDGARYAQKGTWINPDSPDIMFQMADIYDQKLGRSNPERFYYRQRFAEDTARVAKLVGKMTAEQRKNLANSTELSERDKAALLVVYKDEGLKLEPIDVEEYPYGVSPFYFGYEYEMRTRELGSHSTIGDRAIHARPAVCLMGWARSEMLTGVAWAEQMALATKPTEAKTGPLLPEPVGQRNPPVNSKRWKELKAKALFHFEESDRRFSQAIEAFKEHLEKYPEDENTHKKHIYICTYQRAISRGRKELFLAICNILENDNMVTKEAVQKLYAAFSNFKSAIGSRQTDGSYPEGSLLGYQIKHYPWPEEGKPDLYTRDRSELQGLVEELSDKNKEIIKLRLGYATTDAKPVKVDMSLLKLYETELNF